MPSLDVETIEPIGEAAVAVLIEAIEKAGYSAGESITIGLDVASSEFYREGVYRLAAEDTELTSTEFADYLEAWVDKYPIVSVEDGMAEDDWDGWAELTRRIGGRVQLTGDDLFVTNTRILRQGIERGIANSILIKLNQIGTLSETLDAIQTAQQAGYRVTVSVGASGEVQPPAADRISTRVCGRLSGDLGVGRGAVVILDFEFIVSVTAKWQGVVVASGDDTVVVEGNHYFAPEAVKSKFLRRSTTHTRCPWKGTANYYNVVVGDTVNRDAAWYYPEPKPAARQIAGRIAFWRGVQVEES